MYRLVAIVLLVVGLVAWPTGVDAQGATVDATATPIVWVDLTGPQGLVSQGDPTSEILDRGHGPVMVTSVTIDDRGLRSLSPLPVSVGVGGIRLADDANASVTSENGALVTATSNDFPAAVARVMGSADLRHYLRGDGTASNGDNGRLDLDLTFSPALGGDDYLLVAEADPSTELRLSAVTADGFIPETAPLAVLDAGDGWATGFAPADNGTAEAVRLAVVPVRSLLADSGLAALDTVRIDADDAADVKVIPVTAAALTTVETDPVLVETDPEPTPIPGDALELAVGVYAGVDAGAGCAEAAPVAEVASSAAAVTYCYTVTNNGTEPLEGVSVTDPDVAGAVRSIGEPPAALAPGQVHGFYLEGALPADGADGAIDNTHLSTATAAATGLDTAHGYTVTAEAAVRSAVSAGASSVGVDGPAVDLAVTSYASHDGGQSCAGDERTVAAEGDPLTYCYVVTNTGSTYVHGIWLDQHGVDTSPNLINGELAEMPPLAPGSSIALYLEVAAPDSPAAGSVMAATVTANPVDQYCGDLPGLADVTADDGTELTSVATPPPAPEQTGEPEPPTEPIQPPTDEIPGREAPQTSDPSTEAPEQLAHTGWESWMLVMAGIGLVAGGLALSREQLRRSMPTPAPAAASIQMPVPRSGHLSGPARCAGEIDRRRPTGTP
ncbi:MAG: hypothetical protein AAF962_08495 [Actinomycetota bacterium]